MMSDISMKKICVLALLFSSTASFAGCATTGGQQKAELPPLDQGAIGDADPAEGVKTQTTDAGAGTNGGAYRDPLVSATGKQQALIAQTPVKTQNMAVFADSRPGPKALVLVQPKQAKPLSVKPALAGQSATMAVPQMADGAVPQGTGEMSAQRAQTSVQPVFKPGMQPQMAQQTLAVPQQMADASVNTSGNTSASGSLVPPDMPAPRYSATTASVFSVQNTVVPQAVDVQPHAKTAAQMPQQIAMQTAQQGDVTMTNPQAAHAGANAAQTQAVPLMAQPRPATRAEILAGLAPDPHKVRQVVRPRQQAIADQYTHGVPASLQGALPGGVPGGAPGGAAGLSANSGATQMEQIEGAPGAKGMTKDSFIKKFLAKLRSPDSGKQ